MRYTLGDYTLDTHRYELCRAGIPLKLQPKVFDLLAYLIQHRDRVVTRQALFDALWPEQFVSEDALEWVIAAAFDAGTVHATENGGWGILTLGHSSLTLSRNTPTILADGNTVDGILVADTSDLRLDGGTITAFQNGRTGLWFGGTAGLGNIGGTILLQNNTEGARAENLSRIAQLIAGRMTIRNNTIGIIADSGSDVRIDQGGTITDNGTDIVLIFGSRGTFNGNTVGTITCDETSLVRGDTGVTCPTP